MSQKAVANDELSMRQKWLGTHFEREIREGFIPDVSIKWADEQMGFGVFANRPFAKGAYLGEYVGLVRSRSRRLDRKNDYCFEYAVGIKSPWIIDAKNQGNHARFINHSDHPNIEPIAVFADGVMHIIFIALKPIPVGEQLFYEYGPYFWKKRSDKK